MSAVAGPDLFEIIKASNLRSEQMDNHIAEVDQDPVCVRKSLNLWCLPRRFFDLLGQVVGNRAHMTGRPARSNDHNVCERRFFREIDQGEVFGFVVFQ